ncbi:MAG: hypothetical protein MZW92_48815 [Comamonadaceae bacterium]|nr:hypothetical protein [Comamonadaceae bacterium]
MFVFEVSREVPRAGAVRRHWLTEEGTVADAIVGAGTEAPLRGGRTVIEALAPSRLQIIAGGRCCVDALAQGWLRRAWRRCGGSSGGRARRRCRRATPEFGRSGLHTRWRQAMSTAEARTQRPLGGCAGHRRGLRVVAAGGRRDADVNAGAAT